LPAFESDRDAGSSSAAVNVMEASMKAIYDYRINPYPGSVTLFRAKMGSPRILADRFGGWGQIVGGRVEVHDVPGTHMSMFREPHVRELGKKLASVLGATMSTTEKAEATDGV